MRKKIIIILLTVIAIVAVLFVFNRISTTNKDALYISGCEHIQNNEFELALECFEGISEYKDAEDLLKEVRYQLGIQEYNSENLDSSWEYFSLITGYKDTDNFLKEITYKRLLNAIETKELDDADAYANEIPDFRDVAYQKERILFERYMLALDLNNIEQANEIVNSITNESLRQRAERTLEYSRHGYSILSDLKNRVSAESSSIIVKEIRCYQYSYNNSVAVPVYMFYTEYTDTASNVYPRYYAYMDKSYYGFCDTIIRSEIDMKNETQLYTFLKIEPYWDEETTLTLSVGLMEALATSN